MCLGTIESIRYSISARPQKENIKVLLELRTLVVILPTNNYCQTHILLKLNLALLIQVFTEKTVQLFLNTS